MLSGLSYLTYGVFVKTFLVIWLINAVDVVNHTIGYSNYDAGDQSTNSFLMAILHGGGAISWHNNHHAHPSYFSVETKWWEFDLHLLYMRGLQKIGLIESINYLDLIKNPEKENSLRKQEVDTSATTNQTIA